MDSARQVIVALCMLSFACISCAGKVDFPFSEFTAFYSFRARTGKGSSEGSACQHSKCHMPSQGSYRTVHTFLSLAQYTLKHLPNDAGEEVHSVSEPLPAYLLPQDPYFSTVKSFLKPPLGKLLLPVASQGATAQDQVAAQSCCILSCCMHSHALQKSIPDAWTLKLVAEKEGMSDQLRSKEG